MPRTRGVGSSIYDRFEQHADRTFEEAAARYIKEFQGKDKRRAAFAFRSVLPYIGKLRLIDVDDEALQQFKEDRRLGQPPFEKPAMVGTLNKELTLVTTVLRRAARVWRWLPMAPQIEHVKGAERVSYPLTWDEQARLFSHLPTGWNVGAALFAVNTGVRKNELFGLKWSDMVMVPELDVKDENGIVKDRMFVFVLSDTKNGESRAVIPNSIARRCVNRQKGNGSDYVFPSRAKGNIGGRVMDSGTVWIRAWRDAGLPTNPLIRKGIHNLRHTYAHRLRAAGVSAEDRNALLGHARTNLAEHYALPDLERLTNAAELIVVRKDTVVLRSVSA